MRPARARVVGKFSGGAPGVATVTMDRAVGLFSVRPLKRRKVYELPLASVAEFVVWHVTKVELRDKRAAKAAKRKLRRG